MFAELSDIETRMGRLLTTAEQALATQVIDLTTGLIIDAAGQTQAWADALDPVPAYFRVLCIERVIRVGANPDAAQSISEQLGSYMSTKTFPRETALASVLLTDEEQRMVVRFAGGPVSGSARTRSLVHDIYVTE